MPIEPAAIVRVLREVEGQGRPVFPVVARSASSKGNDADTAMGVSLETARGGARKLREFSSSKQS